MDEKELETFVRKDEFKMTLMPLQELMLPGIWDIVKTEPPYFHFDVMVCRDDYEYDRKLEQCKKDKNLFVPFSDGKTIFRYACTTDDLQLHHFYIVDFKKEDMAIAFGKAIAWYKLYGEERVKQIKVETLK